MMLTYVPKRIHFSTRTFNAKMKLAVLDWVRFLSVIHANPSPYIVYRMRMCIERTPATGECLISGDLIDALKLRFW